MILMALLSPLGLLALLLSLEHVERWTIGDRDGQLPAVEPVDGTPTRG
jgi:hypothetical protein